MISGKSPLKNCLHAHFVIVDLGKISTKGCELKKEWVICPKNIAKDWQNQNSW